MQYLFISYGKNDNDKINTPYWGIIWSTQYL